MLKIILNEQQQILKHENKWILQNSKHGYKILELYSENEEKNKDFKR